MATIQVGVHWTIRHIQAIIAVATKESALIGQLVSDKRKKFIYYRATQAIFKKYHSDLYPKLKDNSVTFNAFTKFFEYKVTNEQEFQLTKTYEGPPFPNNDFALALYVKIYGKSKNKDKTNNSTSVNTQSANLAQNTNWCFHPLCRGRNKFATHTWESCHRNKYSAHSKQQANNHRGSSRDVSKTSSTDTSGRSQKRGNPGYKGKSNKQSQQHVKKNSTTMMDGLKPNKHGVYASPAIRHTLTKLHKRPKKNLVPELQRALAVENIATNYVSSGNQEDMVQALRKLSTPNATNEESMPPSTKRTNLEQG